jgi:undecaprenyl-diphosphatase
MSTARHVTDTWPAAVAGRRHPLRVWPLRRPAAVALTKGGLLLLAVWSAAGLLYMWLLDDGPVGDADRAGAEWLADRRTPTWDSLSHIGSMLSETYVKVLLVAVVGGTMVAVWRRWHDGVYLAVVVIFEATVFVLTSFIVGRERPPFGQLDDSAPSGSFPSGHAAAAVAFYASLFVIATWHTRHRGVRAVLALVAVVVPIIVATSRVYRGMHHPLDVAAGVLLGIASIAIVLRAMRAGVDDIAREARVEPLPTCVQRLDLTPEARPNEPLETPAMIGVQP